MSSILVYSVVLHARNSNGAHNGSYITVLEPIPAGLQPAVFADYGAAQTYKNKMQCMYPTEVYEVLSSTVYPDTDILRENYPKAPEQDCTGRLTTS